MSKKILFLEDEVTIAEVTKEYIILGGYEVTHVTDGLEAIEKLKSQTFDIGIFDIMVPNKSGLEVLDYVKKHHIQLPVIMLSALGDETTQVQAFNLFADDYIIKPFSPILLLKRIEALLRRSRGVLENVSSESDIDEIQIDDNTYQAYYNNQSLGLTLTEFLILQVLSKNKNQVFTRNQLLDYVFADDYYPNDRVIDAHIKNLRKKLPYDCIKTVIGVGYRLEGKGPMLRRD